MADDPDVKEMLKNLALAMAGGFAKLNADFELISGSIDVLKDRVGVVESRQSQIEAWRTKNSLRVRGIESQTSEADLSHEAKIAAEIVARQSLEAKVDALDAKQDTQLAMLSSIHTLSKNPIVKQIFTALGTAILSWLAMKGFR